MKSVTRRPLHATVPVEDQSHLTWAVLRVHRGWKEPPRTRALAGPDSGAWALASETRGSRAGGRAGRAARASDSGAESALRLPGVGSGRFTPRCPSASWPQHTGPPCHRQAGRGPPGSPAHRRALLAYGWRPRRFDGLAALLGPGLDRRGGRQAPRLHPRRPRRYGGEWETHGAGRPELAAGVSSEHLQAQAGPTPRYGRTPGQVGSPAVWPSAETEVRVPAFCLKWKTGRASRNVHL